MQKLTIFGVIVFLLYLLPVALFGWEQAVFPKDGIIESDLLKVGDKIINEGTIKGDMLVAGTTIRNQGHVVGDLIGLGSFIHQQGRVEGDGRLLGTEVLVDGAVEKNLSIAGLIVILGQESLVRGNLTVLADNIELNGKVEGNLVVRANSVTISGECPNNVEIYSEALTILPRSKLGGTVTYFGKTAPTVHSTASLATPLVQKQPDLDKGWKQSLQSLLSLLILAVLVILLLPRSMTLLSKRLVENPRGNFFSGMLFLIFIPVVPIALLLLKVGTQSSVTVLSTYLSLSLVSLALAQIAWGTAVGTALWGLTAKIVPMPTLNQTLTLLIQTLLGTLCFWLLGLIPYAGIILQILLTIFTLGAILSLTLSTTRWPKNHSPKSQTRPKNPIPQNI